MKNNFEKTSYEEFYSDAHQFSSQREIKTRLALENSLMYNPIYNCEILKTGYCAEGDCNEGKRGLLDHFVTCACLWVESTGPNVPLTDEYQKIWIAEHKISKGLVQIKKGYQVAFVYYVDILDGRKDYSRAILLDEVLQNDIQRGKYPPVSFKRYNYQTKQSITENMYMLPYNHPSIRSWNEFIIWANDLILDSECCIDCIAAVLSEIKL
jgi:hypothetical protein